MSRARPPAPPRVWLLTPGVLAGALMAALLLSPAHIRTAMAWYGLGAIVLAIAASAETARRLRSADEARTTRAGAEEREYYAQREAALLGRLADQQAATVWLAEELLPAAVARLRRGAPASEVLRSAAFGSHLDEGFAEALRGALGSLLEAVEAEEHTRDASQRTLVAVARRVQAIVHQLAKDLHTMQIVHGNDLVVSRGLQDVDHRNALIGRLAASIAVLGDARPGRQWSKAIPLYDVLRGAMSRIVDYPRVKLTSVAEVAVVGPGSEPMIHLLAELLDNATTFSPPHTPVEVTASEVPSGIAIEIEDRGVGLTEEVRHRIERVMKQSMSGIQLASLGEVTQLGLPVVSRLAREHGCEVDLRTSAYGGVRAVVLVPRNLITTVPQPAMRRFPEPIRKRTVGGPVLPRVVPRVVPPVEASTESGEVRKTPNGLPQRRRESPVPTPVVVAGTTTPPASGGSSGTTRPPGLMWEAFNGDKRASAEPSTSPSEPSDEVE
ncbi:ATP-binding protein [Streptomyces sp. SR27]|uniref:ATP-binding protein n=1 Tax=Streptomyces sp. SR27 TaxID=3076630 RepID=UPI00295A7F26|nr:ATP-binding protein [Streptomyces sp. SR27]MDV9187252.1 ATP-binding protein [Streptomyces sp. SR27]